MAATTAMTDTDHLLTTGEAAALLRVSRRTIRRLLAAGKLPGVRGRQWRLDADALDARLWPRVPPRHVQTANGRTTH